jgi:hypothetical protein
MFGCSRFFAHRAVNYLNGLPLTEAFRRYVIGDPEVAALAQRVLKARPGEAAADRGVVQQKVICCDACQQQLIGRQGQLAFVKKVLKA